MIDTTDDKDREIERLKQELEKKNAEIRCLNEKIARAKDINPVKKFSISRIKRLAEPALLDVNKVERGYELSFGSTLKRVFKRLSHIFDILVLGDWYLSDIFKPDYFAPNKYGYVPPNSSFNDSVEGSDDCTLEPISVLKRKVASVSSLTTLGVHEVINAVMGGTRRLVETVDKYGDIVSQKLSSTPFADSYTDETLNQAQNSYDTWDESLDDFSPA
jgi:hypothetical protein